MVQEPPADPPIDLARVTRALRRSRALVAGMVLLATAVALVISVAGDARYRASARIAENPASAEAADIDAVDRRLATSRELVTAPSVLAGAADRVPGETARTIAAKASAQVDPEAGILDVVATGRDPVRAARIANAVAATFLAEHERMERAVIARARERLTSEIERLDRGRAAGPTVDGLRERLSDLAVSEALAGSALRLVEPAAVPAKPFAPRPVRNALLAAFAALFAGVLVAISRDALRAQAPDARLLSRTAGLPLLAALPDAQRPVRDRFRLRRAGPSSGGWALDQSVIEEAALQASVRLALPPRGQRILLVQGVGRDSGAERVAAGLARSLCWAGHAAVLVQLGAPAPGVALVDGVPRLRLTDPDSELGDLRRSEYRYVIVDNPPVAYGSQLRQLGGSATAVVLVAAVGRATVADAVAARRLIDALGLRGLGLVVTCSAPEAASIGLDGFAAPQPPPARPRTASRNGNGNGNGTGPPTPDVGARVGA